MFLERQVMRLLKLGELLHVFIESVVWRHFYNKFNLYKPHSRRTAPRDVVEMFVKSVMKGWLALISKEFLSQVIHG